MKLDNVIMYYGDELNYISLDHFLKEETISKLDSVQIVDAYTYQKVFVTLVFNIIKQKVTDIDIIDLISKDRLALPKLEKGLLMLENMVLDIHGNQTGRTIVNEIDNLVLNECV